MDLSIIIPVYNTAPALLCRCLDSVQGLRGLNLEVILCDDGSGEETASFCAEYAATHPQFRYLRKENGGVSSARNLGLDHATGRYVAFMDSDDAFLPDSITPDHLSTDSDLVLFDILLDTNGRRSTAPAMDAPSGLLPLGDVMKRLVVTKNLNSPCAKLFKRELIEKQQLRFDTDFVTGEDWLFVCDYLLVCSTVQYAKTPCYIYYRDGSTSLGRLSRFPDTMFANLEANYRRQLSLCDMDWAADQRTQLQSAVAAAWLENLFNLAADLLLMKKLTPERKSRVLAAAREADTHLASDAPKKARQKSMILRRFPIAIGPIALARRLYLKLR